jgi:hypothetical protein
MYADLRTLKNPYERVESPLQGGGRWFELSIAHLVKVVHLLGVTERPVKIPSSPLGGARTPDSVPISLLQKGSTINLGLLDVTSERQQQPLAL